MNVNFIFCKKENKKKINYCSILSLVLEATQHRSIYLRLINCLNSDNQKELFWVNKQKKKEISTPGSHKIMLYAYREIQHFR